jgi:hypothetical protein
MLLIKAIFAIPNVVITDFCVPERHGAEIGVRNPSRSSHKFTLSFGEYQLICGRCKTGKNVIGVALDIIRLICRAESDFCLVVQLW